MHGRELWRSDGTAAGTRLVADLRPGPLSSGPFGLEVIKDAAYLAAFGADGHTEIWRSDGTAAGTRKLVEFDAPASASAAKASADVPRRGFHPLGDEVAFLVPHVEGSYLAATGPAGGARELDVLPAGETTELTLRGSVDDALFFTHNRRLYRTDGTRAGAIEIPVDSGVEELVTVGGHVAIAGYSLDRGWLISTIAPGATRATVLADGSSVMRSIGGRLYFGNQSGLHAWAPGEPVSFIDGHPPVEVIEGSHGVYELTRTGGTLLWTVRSPGGTARLYSWDGANAHPVGDHSYEPLGLTPIGGGRALYYAYDDRVSGFYYGLWVTDGTAAGTRKVAEPDANAGPHTIVSTPHGALYPGFTPQADVELHRSDGTPARAPACSSTSTASPRAPGPSRPRGSATTSMLRTFEGFALWTTDGTAAGTQRLPLRTIP